MVLDGLKNLCCIFCRYCLSHVCYRFHSAFFFTFFYYHFIILVLQSFVETYNRYIEFTHIKCNTTTTTRGKKLRSLKVIKKNSYHIIVVDSISIQWLHFSTFPKIVLCAGKVWGLHLLLFNFRNIMLNFFKWVQIWRKWIDYAVSWKRLKKSKKLHFRKTYKFINWWNFSLNLQTVFWF